MRKCIPAAFLAGFVLVAMSPVRAEEGGDAKAIIDKAIKAMGGEEKLTKALKGSTWSTKGKITFGGNDNPFSTENTLQGLGHYRSKFKGEFMGNEVEGVTVLNGDKGARAFAGMDMELDKDALANEQRVVYLWGLSLFVVPLKEKGFKCESAGEEKVENKAAVGLKIVGPDGKDSKLYLDKETGLPVKQVAKINNFMGQEVTEEKLFSNYKEMGGIQRPGKIIIKHDGEKLMEMELTECKVLDKVDPKIFEKP
jgi:hypothetical protein